MKIIVDAFGGDNAPLEILKGCAEAVAEYGVNILLVGSKRKIEKIATENGILLYHMEIIDVEDVITNEDDPSEIIKSKNNCTMAQGLKLLAQGEGNAFVSAGNSGALVMGATFIVKRIKGIKRCALHLSYLKIMDVLCLLIAVRMLNVGQKCLSNLVLWVQFT